MALEKISQLIITSEDIRYVLDTEVSFTTDYLSDPDNTSLPTVLKVIDTSNQIQLFHLDAQENLNNELTRRKMLASAGAEFRQRCKMRILPAIAIFSFRAWIKAYKSEKEFNPLLKPMALSRHATLSDYVDSIDAIVIQVLTANLRAKNKLSAWTGLAILEVVQKKPTFELKEFSEPQIERVANWQNANLLSDFYLGWFKQGAAERN